VLDAVRGGEWTLIAAFVVGCATGLLSFVHLLRWLLRVWHDPVMALLAGFMAGSLIKLWPWRVAAENGFREHWLSPAEYALVAGSAMLPQAIMALIAGALVVVVLTRLDRRGHRAD
jgi:putative membrane protein